MAKIFIIGIVASGKTTLAKQIAKETGISHHEVDVIVHEKTDQGRRKRSDQEQLAVIEEINEEKSWIIEGTYRKSCDRVLTHADKVIFLDPPLALRKRRILTRFVKQVLGIEACHYKPTVKMLKAMYRWTRGFEEDRPQFETKLATYKDKLEHCKSFEEAYTVAMDHIEQTDKLVEVTHEYVAGR